MKAILPIVEGDGEIAAVPVLLRDNLLPALGIHYRVRILSPIKVPRDRIVRAEFFQPVFDLARRPEKPVVLVLFDADDDCAGSFVPAMRRWAAEAAADIPCRIVMISREFEAWFLASAPSLFNGQVYAGEAERKRDAKGAVGELLGRRYSETEDQEKLCATLDPGLAYRNSPTFRRFVREVCQLLEALGETPIVPLAWIEIPDV